MKPTLATRAFELAALAAIAVWAWHSLLTSPVNTVTTAGVAVLLLGAMFPRGVTNTVLNRKPRHAHKGSHSKGP